MKAVILAAGQGTRLKKYTRDLPKGMLVFQGRTIIERQMELYRGYGIEDIIIVRGFAGDKIRYKGVRYYTNKDYACTNMVESFMAARNEFDDDIILSYSDILFTEDMLKAMAESQDDFAVAVDTQWERYWQMRYGRTDFDTESLRMDEHKNIKSLGLANPPLQEIDARYIGLLKFTKRALQSIQELWDEDLEEYRDKPWQQSGNTIRKAYMTDLLNALIQRGQKIKAVEFANGWLELDTDEDYEKACRWAQNGQLDQILPHKP